MRMRNHCLLLTISFLFAATAGAQGKRPMTLVELLEVPQLSEPRISPDGRQLLYELAEADWKANRRVSHIWRIDSDGSGQVQLTNGEQGEQSPRWSPDGTRVAFVAERGDIEEEQIYLISNEVGEAVALTDHPTSVSDITWAPDGGSIYFLAEEPLSEEEKRRKEAKDDVFAYDEDYKQQHLWKVSVEDGTEVRITGGDFSILEYRLSRDGSRIAHHRAPTPLIDDRDERPGSKFKDSELLGVPLRVTVGERGLRDGMVELFVRKTGEVKPVPVGEAVERAAGELERLRREEAP